MLQTTFSTSLLLSLLSISVSAAGIFHMTQNSLNGAKFYELRRAPTKIRESFRIEASSNFTPTAICDSEHIGLALNENFADVRIFASEHSEAGECSRRFSLESEPEFVTRLDGPCGVRRMYKGAPSTSVNYSLRLIVSHNPLEITEHDKIYDVTCSFSLKSMEVRAEYDIKSPPVSRLSSTTSLSSNVQKPGPKCKYSLHFGTVQGPRTSSAHVGETIFHRWKCAAPQNPKNPSKSSSFIFKVYACVVHDEHNRTYTIIDENGCSLDEEIIPTPEYDVANGLIYTPSKAFRFANSNHVHFKCMVSVCPASEASCRNSVPPKCKASSSSSKRSPRKRQVPEEMTIEQRLLRIHDLMKQKRAHNSNVTLEVKRGGVGTEMVQAEPLRVVRTDYDALKYEQIIRTYQMWTWILCSLNVLLVVVCICVTFRWLKNKYIMDIKDTTNTVFRRVPF